MSRHSVYGGRGKLGRPPGLKVTANNLNKQRGNENFTIVVVADTVCSVITVSK